ncbi:20755_t:CDS:2, partial [Dentiscutata erythropus]
RKLIQDLEDGTSFIHKHHRNSKKTMPNSLIREQIIKLGVTYSLVSKYTSFLAVDEKDSELVAEAKILSDQRVVPVAAASFSVLRSRSLKSKSVKSMTSGFNFMPAPKSFLSSSSKRASSYKSSRRLESSELEFRTHCICLADKDSSFIEVTSYVGSNNSSVSVLPATPVKSKPPKIETLYSFLNFQSFDGSFLPSAKFYSWFGKHDFKDFENIGIENEKVLCLTLALAYLEIIMFGIFKDECEMCYEKAKKALKKEVGGDEQKINEILEKVKEWVNKWTNE